MTPVLHTHRDLHEKLSCHTVLRDTNLIKQMQNYLFYYLTYYKTISALSKDKSTEPFELHITFTTDDNVFTENEYAGLREAIKNMSVFAKFDLEVRYRGLTGDLYEHIEEVDFYYPDILNNYTGLYDYLQKSTERNLDYSVIAYYEDHDELVAESICDEECTDIDTVDRMTVAQPCDDIDLMATNDFSILIAFDFEANEEQYENIKEAIEEYVGTGTGADLQYIREMWEEGEWVGFTDLTLPTHNIGDLAQLMECISEELEGIDEDVEIQLNGMLFDLERMIYAKMMATDERTIILGFYNED